MSETDLYRHFGSEEANTSDLSKSNENPTENSVDKLRDVLGAMRKVETPFGGKPIVYADWIASGRCLYGIEKYLARHVLPFYGNTHTTTSITGHQSTCFRQEARQIVAEAVNAKVTGRAAEDTVLFVGNGTTAAVDKLITMLGFHQSKIMELEDNLRPIVFCSSFEHHSNLLPWRECGADVVEIAYDAQDGVSLKDLEEQLRVNSHRKVKIGAISAASNVTGVLTNVDAVSILLHQHNALSFFDYATAAPHVAINMNPSDPLAKKDAVYFSGHKFLGGPGSSGVLVTKRWLLPQASEAPSVAGGGTVFYVTDEHHRYLSNREEREEGGSPQLLGDVKLALSMNLLREVGLGKIASREEEISREAFTRLSSDPRVVLLGKHSVDDKFLPIFSFLIRAQDRFLHFHFVSVLLNDLFGIQCRGGCVCAGPFAQRLLGLSSDCNAALECSLLDKHEVMRPGFTRISFSFWMSPAEVDYIISAILFVAEHGWKFLHVYRYNYKTGEWAHTSRLTRFPERLWLSNFSAFVPETFSKAGEDALLTLNDVLRRDWNDATVSNVLMSTTQAAMEEVAKMEKLNTIKAQRTMKSGSTADSNDFIIDAGSGPQDLEKYNELRWYLLPTDINFTNSTGSLSGLVGAVRPTLPDRKAVSSSESVTTSFATMTAYAETRSLKITRRTGQEDKLPRFLRLFTAVGADQSLLEALKFNAFSLYKAVDNKSDTKTASEVPSASAAATTNGKKNGKDRSVLENALASAVETSNTDQQSTLDTCSTGTCVLRTEPTGYENNVVMENGRILSGPGNFFPPNPSLITGKFFSPPKKLMKAVGQAIKEWGMIQEGDRLLLGLSGGKDSLAMLHVLRALQIRAPVKFEFACATVDPQTTSFDPSTLIPYVQSLGVTYHYLSQPIIQLAKSKLQGDSLCAFCARFKRGLLYSCCRTYGYTKLILAQHLDDLCESFLMSLLHNGQTRTMKAKYLNETGDITVIRPFIYVRETATRDFSIAARLPIINENCPACFEEPKERARVKKLLQQEEAMVPNLFYNLKRALVPLMHDDTYHVLKAVADKITEAGNVRFDGNKSSRKKGRDEDKVAGDEEEDVTAPVSGNAEAANTGTEDEEQPVWKKVRATEELEVMEEDL